MDISTIFTIRQNAYTLEDSKLLEFVEGVKTEGKGQEVLKMLVIDEVGYGGYDVEKCEEVYAEMGEGMVMVYLFKIFEEEGNLQRSKEIFDAVFLQKDSEENRFVKISILGNLCADNVDVYEDGCQSVVSQIDSLAESQEFSKEETLEIEYLKLKLVAEYKSVYDTKEGICSMVDLTEFALNSENTYYILNACKLLPKFINDNTERVKDLIKQIKEVLPKLIPDLKINEHVKFYHAQVLDILLLLQEDKPLEIVKKIIDLLKLK